MAPEVILKNYNNLSDIWSIGMIFYIMMTKENPFLYKNQKELFNSICFKEIDYKNI